MKKFLFALMLFVCATASAQQLNVTGTVTDPNQEPLIGAMVTVVQSSQGTITDMDGHFQISVPKGTKLTISSIGFASQTVVAQSEKSMTIVLKEDVKLLEEVVVIGYGAVKRKDVTTAITTVDTKDMDNRPIVSAGQALQGKAAGVAVTRTSGAPGAELSIRVRGTTSFNGNNDPLYVVDGMPVDNIKFLSPNDIESLQVLKDASAAAIYGSRAANGVVLIGTKSGKAGTSKITFNAQLSLNQVVNNFDVLNTAQYKELQDEIGIVNIPDGLQDVTDWSDVAYRTGVSQNYQVGFTGGNEKMNYYLSAGYTDEKGSIKTTYFKRYNFNGRWHNDIRKWLTLDAKVTYSDYTGNSTTTGLGANRGGMVLAVINTPTYAPIMSTANPNEYNGNFFGINNVTSPAEILAQGKDNETDEDRLILSGSLTFKPFKNFTYKSSLSMDRRHGLSTTFVDPEETETGRINKGTASDNRNRNTVLTFDNVANYNFDIQKHHVDIMAGSSWTDSDYSNSWINGSHFRSGDIKTLNAANQISWTGTGTGGSTWGILSFFGRMQYNFDSKYMLTFNMRADGSSKLNPDDRWGYFPSASGAWRISSESFMSDIEWIDDLKLRAGWGQTGNQSGIGDYSYLQMYGISRQAWFEEGKEQSVPSIYQTNLRNSDLTWETTTQTNIGLDATLLRNRLNVTVDYYYKNTTDMLMNVTLPSGAATANSITRNEGEMTNKGFEFSVTSHNFVDDFKWDTNFNISFNKNKLKKLELQQVYYDAKTSDFTSEYVVRNEPGRSLGGFYGYVSQGVDPETGDMIYKDLNGDGKITSSDRTYIGDPNPDFTYGLTNTFSWKGLSLNVFIQGVQGNDIFNASRIETEGMFDGKNQSTKVLKRWRTPGQITHVPRANYDLKNSTYFIEDGSYIRLKEVTLSYNIQSAWLKNMGINKFQPYFTASNLYTWTDYSGIDPEVNQWGNSGAVQGIDWGSYPQSKTYLFGINVEF
ncbi:MAG TPA: TonB-dependent receptor [Bacteroidaceae bacterium]|nr:TonB-dependent receptor [Bacteroidaceae bacterium]